MWPPWLNRSIEVKPYYTPIEAAIRWCGLTQYEAQIITETGENRVIPPHNPQCPLLRQRTELIHHALEVGEIPTGIEGRETNDFVPVEKRTVSHDDLKSWMEERHPDQKPVFLFGETVRQTHPATNTKSFQKLQSEILAVQKQLEEAAAENKALRDQNKAIESERDSIKSLVTTSGVPEVRSETSYKHTIAALLDCIEGNLHGVEKHPSFTSVAKLIETIDMHYAGYYGLSKSNLSRKFPEARKALLQAK